MRGHHRLLWGVGWSQGHAMDRRCSEILRGPAHREWAGTEAGRDFRLVLVFKLTLGFETNQADLHRAVLFSKTMV